MTQAQLDRHVARRTGESLRTVRRLGFHLRPALDPGPGDPHLAVACPRCGGTCPLPRDRGGPAAMAESGPCDLRFGYRPADVRVAG